MLLKCCSRSWGACRQGNPLWSELQLVTFFAARDRVKLLVATFAPVRLKIRGNSTAPASTQAPVRKPG